LPGLCNHDRVPTTPPVLAIAGAAGSGKSTLADAVAAALGAPVVRLDDCYHTDPGRAPSVARYDGPGRVVNFSDPASIDLAEVDRRLGVRRGLTIVEGIFALTLDTVRSAARWTVFVDTPPDVSIARKTLRKIGEGRDPRLVLRGHLEHGHAAHARHIAPARAHAGLVVDGMRPTAELSAEVCRYVAGRTP
jgi:uridine kinase